MLGFPKRDGRWVEVRTRDEQDTLRDRRRDAAGYGGPERRSTRTAGIAAARSRSAGSLRRSVPVMAALVDAAVVMCSLLLGMWVSVTWFDAPTAGVNGQMVFALCTLPMWIAVFAWQRLYAERDDIRMLQDVLRVVSATAMGALGYILLAWPINLDLPRATVGVAVLALIPALLAERQLIRIWVRRGRRKGRGLRPVAIMGSNSEAIQLAESLVDPLLGRRVVGFIAAKRDVPGQLCGVEVRYSTNPAATAADMGVEGVVIAATALDSSAPTGLLRSFLDRGIGVEMTSALTGVANDRIHVHTLGPHPLIAIDPGFRGGWRAIAKRAFDLVVGSLLLLLASPVVAAACLAVLIESGRPLFFSQDRLGHRGRRFKVHKIRTMVVGAETMRSDLEDRNESDGPLFKMSDDPRVTRVGRVLRKFSIDEIPQLWNVIKGEMSLVGPRPALAHEADDWSDELRNRLRVRPGITGMWQVNGRSDASFDEYERLDLFYIDNWSILTDISILVRTVPVVLFRKGAR